MFQKGQGAYFSSGSRPNQTGHSWGYARMASAITGGKASAVDFKIIKENCKKNSRAYKLAKKAYKKYKKGTKRVKQVQLGGRRMKETIVKFKKGDYVLDIASNDGTLLKSYKLPKINYIGIDPTITQFKKFYPKF